MYVVLVINSYFLFRRYYYSFGQALLFLYISYAENMSYNFKDGLIMKKLIEKKPRMQYILDEVKEFTLQENTYHLINEEFIR